LPLRQPDAVKISEMTANPLGLTNSSMDPNGIPLTGGVCGRWAMALADSRNLSRLDK
jgi:hypothetical protein